MHFKEIADFALWLHNVRPSDLISALSEINNMNSSNNRAYNEYMLIKKILVNKLMEIE